MTGNPTQRAAAAQSAITATLDADQLRPMIAVEEVEGIPYLATPANANLHCLKELLPQPSRIKAVRELEEPDSFCAYVDHFKSDQTRIFGFPDKHLFSAILDDHVAGAPHWGDHRVELGLKLSPEWKEWLEARKKQLGQQDLAEFFEEHIEQIAEPSASDLLSDIRNIHISNNTRCDSVQREGGDIAFTLSTETSAGTRTERGRIPSRLTLVIAPFRSWQPVQMTVLLGYKLSKECGLAFTLRALYAEQLLNTSFNDVRNYVAERIGLPILI